MAAHPHTTVAYKHLTPSLSLSLDFYPPKSPTSPDAPVPTLVYFHGGGLTVGDRKSWFPAWLHDRTTAAGIAFLSADYRLLPPATGHDILADILALFAFLASPAAHALRPPPDPARLAVAGTSAGVLCAYLAAAHAQPAPRAVLALYGMGGDFLTPHYLAPKTRPFFRGRPLLDPAEYAAWLHPAADSQLPCTGAPLVYDAAGVPAHPRMLLARLYLQLGVFLDYYTGVHAPSLSAALRTGCAVPEELRALFPQLCVTGAWPPTMCVHGADDTAVRVGESEALCERVRAAGRRAELRVVPGQEHSFDYQEGAEGKFGALFDECVGFMEEGLRGTR